MQLDAPQIALRWQVLYVRTNNDICARMQR